MQVHSLANGPEVTKPLLETSRKGYLAALSASSYSFVSMMQRFAPIMNEGGAAISLTYIAADQVIPGYGGGMSSAKAALESDTKVLAYEAGRKHKVIKVFGLGCRQGTTNLGLRGQGFRYMRVAKSLEMGGGVYKAHQKLYLGLWLGVCVCGGGGL